jgi:glutamine synthetase
MAQPTHADVVQHAERLRGQGARLLCGAISDTGGVLRAKAVPAERIETFATAGMGASACWPVFCVDNGLALTDGLGVVGDLRLTADIERAVVLDNGFAWAPADVHTQDGAMSPLCWRDVARRQVQALARQGVTVRAGYEIEFVLFDSEGRRVGDDIGWPAYGLGPLSSQWTFVDAALERLAEAGIPVDQVHAEYAVGQVEMSLPPTGPVEAADAVVLARTILGRTARELGLMVSFSPMPFPGGAGNGGHLHVSFARGDKQLLSGGSLPGDLTPEGGHMVAGIVAGLPESIAVLAGSVVSADRLAPNHWSGPFSCWGVENREAAVRLVMDTPGNPYGASAEVKCIDGAANPYLAAGLVLGLAARGLEEELPLPDPIGVNPFQLTDREAAAAGVVRLPGSLRTSLELFERGKRAEAILGPDLHGAVVAVRRKEQESFRDHHSDRYALTRFAWSA